MYTFPLTMQSSPMTLTLTKHASKRIYQRSLDEPELVLVELAMILEQEDIADYLMCEVPIGEEVIIFDEDRHRSFALTMDTCEIRVCTVFYTIQEHRIRASQSELCVIVKNAVLQCAGVFGAIQNALTAATTIA